MTRRLAFAALSLLALVPPGALLADFLQTFSSRTVGVRVDVLVTHGRMPVGGLTAADFELRDNGVLQSIEIVDSPDRSTSSWRWTSAPARTDAAGRSASGQRSDHRPDSCRAIASR